MYLLRLKSDVLVQLKQIFLMIKNQIFTTIKTILSDNRSEVFNIACIEFFRTMKAIH